MVFDNRRAGARLPTALELAVADGSIRKYRLGLWSSWGIRYESLMPLRGTRNDEN